MKINHQFYNTYSMPDFNEPEDFQQFFNISRKRSGDFFLKKEKRYPRRFSDRITPVDDGKAC
jgi:hypothetical protein